jgi:hypothetical protein
VLGHSVTYWLVVPNGGQREALLASTGHAYWGAAVSVAIVAAASAAVGQVVDTLRLARRFDPLRQLRSFRHVGRQLVVLQVVGFTVMEVSERLTAGEPLSTSTLFDHGTLLMGLIVQALVAVTIAGAITLVTRATRRVARWLAADRPSRASRRARTVTCPERVVAAAAYFVPTSVRLSCCVPRTEPTSEERRHDA